MTRRREFRILLAGSVSTIALGTVVYHWLESLSWVDSYYLSVVTLATVGFGDIAPRTDAGQLFTTLYILLGVGIIGAFFNFRIKYRAEQMHERRQRRAEQEDSPDSSE